ncbi:hypothetical protein PM10SUCC1_03800 [Propionigenium maris DSM 9537]|uniref:Uncharacterized protein n=1 Tax=Propionigenium maris DSM 9537 TaxID=1123000 RepID=A0A9W6GIN2_9FUSO|nr:hypothetical protein [Propionigenium maris]GLI54865.1 hypothetical protein PM10SUCC1_03800 [Propionigenium maris DSM 9537]
MVDFDAVDKMIDIVESGEIPSGSTFNDFAIKFYLESKALPLSKYLRNKGKTKRLPKIMNTRKAGEVLWMTEKDEDTIKFLKRRGYKEIPKLDYTCVMLLRKTDLLSNWTKILSYFEGKGTIEEINNSTRTILLPDEKEKLETFVIKELNVNQKEYDWLINKYSQIIDNKEVGRAIRKLMR